MKTMRLLMLMAAAAILLAIPAVYAAEEGISHTVEISPYLGMVFPQNNIDEDDDEMGLADLDIEQKLVYGLRLGYNWTELFGTELEANLASTGFKDTDFNFDIQNVRLCGLFNFNTYNLRWIPYFKIGGGRMKLNPDTFNSEVDTAISAGGGVRYIFPESRVGFRFELLGVMGDDVDSYEATAGLSILLGHAKVKDADGDGVIDKRDKCPGTPSGAIVDEVGCPKDSDGDGVFDGIDRCPDTPKGAVVDAAGCPKDSDGDGVWDGIDKCPDTPKGAIVDATGCPKDTDGDGVWDGIDKCPDTPKGVPVDKTGCSKDSDGDGVLDGIDRCPDTPKGVIVDEYGCPKDSDGDGVWDGIDKCIDTPKGVKVDARGCPEVGEIVVLEDLFFDTNKYNIDAQDAAILDKWVDLLKKNPDIHISVNGHTDSQGSDSYNMKLSDNRAKAVMDYLVSKGIEKARITAKGYGETQPRASNDTKEGMAKNRRVEIKRVK